MTAFSLSRLIHCTVLAAAVCATALAASPAMAKGPSSGKSFAGKSFIVSKPIHTKFYKYRYYGPSVVLASAYATSGSCYALKVRARSTGSAYWWDRYNACVESY
jgi:hypothetical protein